MIAVRSDTIVTTFTYLAARGGPTGCPTR
jgi:hypothetical protein